ncbi:aspartate/glutamate racemase family protein [Erwinia sp. S63]|uniref:aspartate/glutamate racemase family protein n=1 Tax=Erwinia sp. S63 TaxID=2769341 RepID=UPI00190D4A6E|nr:aspartate/glutamate racemase family protein [Erwinia sp. S63]MBK0095442.1 aspartate/glutamate racemase family protein [Erwinia sp. S63]
MKVIGLIGGMSWESSAEYYRFINEQIRTRLGGAHSAKSLMWSMDFGEIESLQHQGEWGVLTQKMCEAAVNLEKGGADFIIICTNTMHRMAETIEANIAIPLLHIADPTAQKIKDAGISRIGLLGTAFTMEQDFYKGRLSEKFGLDVIIPDDEDRKIVHDVIYHELVSGVILDESRDKYRKIIQKLVDNGAQGIILGCTEIMLLVSQQDSSVPIFDTTEIHALAAVDRALGN